MLQAREVADGVTMLSFYPRAAISAYVADGILFDAGVRGGRRALGAWLQRQDITHHALTHAHPDHQGCSAWVRDRFDVPVLCGRNDVEALQTGDVLRGMPVDNPVIRLAQRAWKGPACSVDTVLQEGDRIGDWLVLETPGHTPGHLAFFRERDRTLILGDVLNHMNLLTTAVRLGEPPWFFTPDPAENRRSARRLAALRPQTVLFGHGPPLRDPDALTRFVASLPD